MNILRQGHSSPLAELTTLRVGGCPVAEIRLDTAEDYEGLSTLLEQEGFPVRVLGGGSNLLVREGSLPFAVLRPLNGAGQTPEAIGPDPLASGEERMLIRAGAGLRMPALLSWCAAHGLSGLEGLIGVPGRLGGATAMNAGAYGCSFAPLLRELTVFTPEQGLHRVAENGWNCAYRHFSLREPCAWFLVTDALLSLPVKSPEEVRSRMKENLNRKKSTQPVTARTAGCIFKNPDGESAGKLLEQAGMKGRTKGGMKFSEKHANFLVNEGRGSYAAARELIAEAEERVARTSGITLEMEIMVWS